MAYEPTQWRSGDTITSERLNKMEQGIAGSGSGEFYALHTTRIYTPAENEGDNPTITYSSVELREDGLPMWLIVDNAIDMNNVTVAQVGILNSYDDELFHYSDSNYDLVVNRSTGKVTDEGNGGGAE